MKTLVVSIFALTMLGAGAAYAEGAGVGAHVGPIHLGVGVHASAHHRHCVAWGRRHHQRNCRRWG